MMEYPQHQQHLHAVVDMGSNGIRFSISDLSPPAGRTMPVLFSNRVGISLYDAQYSSDGSRVPIPQKTIDDVVSSLLAFKETCRDFDVPPDHIQLIATEATRTAKNSGDFMGQITRDAGLDVELLDKTQEGRVGALGIASSLSEANGLVIDMGGGSIQLTWIQTEGKTIKQGESVSLPLGAAAVLERLKRTDRNVLFEEINHEMQEAVRSLKGPMGNLAIPDDQNEVPLLLTGGGFRGWGSIVMQKRSVEPWPIQDINGFACNPAEFTDVETIEKYVRERKSLAGISSRRREQIPAIGLMISVLHSVVSKISSVRFCSGGVREGILWTAVPIHDRARLPAAAAAEKYAPASSTKLLRLIENSIPPSCPRLIQNLLEPFVYLMYTPRNISRGHQSGIALRAAVVGPLAGVLGIDHEERAAIGLMLCERWGDDLSSEDTRLAAALARMLPTEIAWWTKYVGRIGAFIAKIYPAGVVRANRVALSVKEQGMPVSNISLNVEAPNIGDSVWHRKALEQVEKLGKKLNGPKSSHETRQLRIGITVKVASTTTWR